MQGRPLLGMKQSGSRTISLKRCISLLIRWRGSDTAQASVPLMNTQMKPMPKKISDAEMRASLTLTWVLLVMSSISELAECSEESAFALRAPSGKTTTRSHLLPVSSSKDMVPSCKQSAPPRDHKPCSSLQLHFTYWLRSAALLLKVNCCGCRSSSPSHREFLARIARDAAAISSSWGSPWLISVALRKTGLEEGLCAVPSSVPICSGKRSDTWFTTNMDEFPSPSG
mmetsp:Transcript_86470/g.207103  ORF Transcript_86470/g.207103 Transcript_86470/m.207103 type:complete len:227 (-) Transcript_86470:899-1579(-)